YFFFQAEDGIRDFHVTGVQTCALPISETDPAAQRKGALHKGGPPMIFGFRPARLEPEVRAEEEAAATGVVDASQERTATQLAGREVVVRVVRTKRRGLVEQVVHAEPEADVIRELVARVQVEDVVGRPRRTVG